MRPLRLAVVLAAGLLGGCVYYNGMYNTNRLAKAARKAEREGRTFEATNLWGQVVTRAESVVVRHPRSKYADQANVLRGLALARIDQCPTAVGPLGRVADLPQRSDFAEEAALALGRCQLQLGDAGLADLAFARVIDSRDSLRRREARSQHAHALRLNGRYQEALDLLREHPDFRNRDDLLLSLAGVGDTASAFALADSLLASGDSTVRWDSLVVSLGGQDPRSASALVDRLVARGSDKPEVQARWLYEDGIRLASVDSARAQARLEAAAATPGRVEAAERARLRLLRLALARSRTEAELARLDDSLTAMAEREGVVSAEAEALAATSGRLRSVTDSLAPTAPQGDLRLFLAGEAARDTLGAPLLAAGLFRRVADEWPASPYAPKALLAAHQLDPSEPDDARILADSVWAGSPYLAMLRGQDAPGYAALEDSLAAFAASQPVGTGSRNPRVFRRRPVLPEDDPNLRENRAKLREDRPSNLREDRPTTRPPTPPTRRTLEP